MKDFFSIKYSDKLLHVWLLIYRVVVSAFMLTHGLPKLYRFFGDQEIRFADPLGIGVIPSLVLVVFAEFFCSILLIVGYKTRLATIPLIITMIVIAFIHHAGDPFNRIELGLMFLVAYIGILITGPGKYSVDGLMRK
jgi:putative oxidoreductase